jgi:hypothetical protein
MSKTPECALLRVSARANLDLVIHPRRVVVLADTSRPGIIRVGLWGHLLLHIAAPIRHYIVDFSIRFFTTGLSLLIMIFDRNYLVACVLNCKTSGFED